MEEDKCGTLYKENPSPNFEWTASMASLPSPSAVIQRPRSWRFSESSLSNGNLPLLYSTHLPLLLLNPIFFLLPLQDSPFLSAQDSLFSALAATSTFPINNPGKIALSSSIVIIFLLSCSISMLFRWNPKIQMLVPSVG